MRTTSLILAPRGVIRNAFAALVRSARRPIARLAVLTLLLALQPPAPAYAASGDCAKPVRQSDYQIGAHALPPLGPIDQAFLIENCGRSTWTTSNWSFRGTDALSDFALTVDVPPGAQITVTVRGAAPADAGTFRYGFLLQHGGETIGPWWFADVEVQRVSSLPIATPASAPAQAPPAPARPAAPPPAPPPPAPAIPPETPLRPATLFEHVDHAGRFEAFAVGDHADLRRSALGQNIASSVQVGSGFTLVACSDVLFGGICEIFTTNQPDLRSHPVGNDRISSLRVIARGFHDEGRAEIVRRLYRDLLGREAEFDGFAFWYETGLSEGEIRQRIIASPEYARLHGAPSSVFALPARGQVHDCFADPDPFARPPYADANYQGHTGLDIFPPADVGSRGNPVYAVYHGTVVGRSSHSIELALDPLPREYAGVLPQLDGIRAYYAHISESPLVVGSRVQRSQLIGYGRDPSGHVHVSLKRGPADERYLSNVLEPSQFFGLPVATLRWPNCGSGQPPIDF